MARLNRICVPGIPQHIIQRGNNRQACFVTENDFSTYANCLLEASRKYGVEVHAWVFMTNHVHLLATPAAEDSISRMMQSVGRKYVRYFNDTYSRTGTLWEGRFKSCQVETDNYFLTCQRYIELNPVRAGMVRDPAEYHWSSYCSNGRGVQAELWTPHECYLKLGDTQQSRLYRYRDLFRTAISDELMNEIRSTVNKGLAFGNDRFREELEHLTNRRMSVLKPGPKKS
ncbi:transposase [Nitrincola alkalilacustris]|uniref:transposase n=1 Tax=Nitrincola alkalilacustris TaxID=1571224 RepID=UPI00124E68DA|nr:transposase [Nitrincola alkalilacustris]